MFEQWVLGAGVREEDVHNQGGQLSVVDRHHRIDPDDVEEAAQRGPFLLECLQELGVRVEIVRVEKVAHELHHLDEHVAAIRR